MTSNYTLNVTSNTTRYCDLNEFAKTYREFHGYFSIFVCVFGSVANILNVCVLTMREMRWPTNFILTGLAVADLLVMLDYIPYAIHSCLDPQSRVTASYFTYPWTVYMFFHALFAQVCHFISCCLTLILAVWRYIAITRPQNNNTWCNMKRTKYAIILTYIMCTLLCFPLFLSLTIHPVSLPVYNNGTLVPLKVFPNLNSTDATNQTIYVLKYSEVPIYNSLSFWVYGVVIKLVPCILLTILSKQLIFALIDAQKKRYNLLSNKNVPLENMNGKTACVNKRLLEKEQQTDRTTRMLLAVLLLFLITEFPQAILVLLVAILGDDFDKQCHRPLGDLQDIFALTNSAINFILYCTMSAQFRTAFKKLFEPKICHRFLSKTCNSDNLTKDDKTAVTHV